MKKSRVASTSKTLVHALVGLAATMAIIQIGAASAKTAPPVSCSAPGCLDAAFGAGGVAQFDVSPGAAEFSNGLVVQPDGRIVSAGFASASTGSAMKIVRVLTDGTIDSSFGVNGVVTPQFTTADDVEQATAVTIAPDLDGVPGDFDIVATGHAVIAAGKGRNSPGFGCAVVRLNSDGTLEENFGTGGKLVFAFDPGRSAICNAIAVDMTFFPVGNLVVAGQSDTVAALARLDPYGNFDMSFGSSGKVLTAESDGAGAYSVCVDADGRVLIGTRSSVLRRQWNGSPDTSFGSLGRVATGITNGGWGGLAIDSTGRILFAGDATKTVQTSVRPARYTTTTDLAVLALLSSGARDTGFGQNGLATLDLGSANDFATGLAVDSSGRILVSGWSGDISTFIAVRFLADGNPDLAFGTGALATWTIDPQGARPNAGVIATANGIVLAGQAGPAQRTTIARYVQ